MDDSQSDNNNNSKKTKDGKLPAFQFYPGDWKRHPGLTSLSPAERWYWLELVMLMHESRERGVLLLGRDPMPEEAIARNLNLDNQNASNLLSKLLAYGVATKRQEDGAICCDWMLKQENIRSLRRIAGLQGGNPNLLKQKTTTGDKQKTTPSYSSSSSDQIQIDTHSEKPQIEAPARRRGKVKDKLTNLIDMTEVELTSLGRHPSPLAPRHLTRKKEELLSWDEHEHVWLTAEELARLQSKLGEARANSLIETLSEYIGIHPDKAPSYADHNLTIQNWHKRNP